MAKVIGQSGMRPVKSEIPARGRRLRELEAVDTRALRAWGQAKNTRSTTTIASVVQSIPELSAGEILHAAVAQKDIALLSVIVGLPADACCNPSRVGASTGELSRLRSLTRTSPQVVIPGEEQVWRGKIGINPDEIADIVIVLKTFNRGGLRAKYRGLNMRGTRIIVRGGGIGGTIKYFGSVQLIRHDQKHAPDTLQ